MKADNTLFVNGKSHSGIEISESCNQKIVDVRSWASGNYTLSLFVNGKLLKTAKITISK